MYAYDPYDNGFDSISEQCQKLLRALIEYHAFLTSSMCDPLKANSDGMVDLMERWIEDNQDLLLQYRIKLGQN